MDKETEEKIKISPSEYLKQRRPENYSDSIVEEQPQLNKTILQFHLEHLTSNSQENNFEYFAKKLMQREICPNLIPQTGPTGGGDSKADSETHPVSEKISLRWYHPEKAGNERWAFAMSAKKDWKPKVKSDVKAIVETNRGYTKVFFISNQPISSKKRSETEDFLSKEFGVDVTIFSRDYIVETIMEKNYYDLCKFFTSMEGFEFKREVKKGPNDAKKDVILSELEQDINNVNKYEGIEYQLAEDCLLYAEISAELEKPKADVEKFYDRAIKIAKEKGTPKQQLRFYYKKAWTLCYTYDDVESLNNLYDKVEEFAVTSDDANDLELLVNLLNTLVGCVKMGQIEKENISYDERSKKLLEQLNLLASQDSRPNNAQHARTQSIIHRFANAGINESEPQEIENILAELEEVISSSRSLGQYPFESYAKIIYEMGNWFDGLESYEKLFETTNQITLERNGEKQAGISLLTRGMQKLNNDNVYEAIKLFGKAQDQLIKDESKTEIIRCLFASGAAYKQAELYWAARSSFLNGISICLSDFEKSGYIPKITFRAITELLWIELLLGRLTNILFCLRLLNVVVNHFKDDEYLTNSYNEFIVPYDSILSIAILKTQNKENLGDLVKLVKSFEESGLFMSEGTSLFCLGELDIIKEYNLFGESANEEEISCQYDLMHSQPANLQLNVDLRITDSDIVNFKTNILGCEVDYIVSNNPESILISETFLSALEAFFATSLDKGVHNYLSSITIEISPNESINSVSGIDIKLDKERITVAHAPNFDLRTRKEMEAYRETTNYFLSVVIPKLASFGNIEEYIKTLAEDENVFGRAITFSDSITVSKNVFGNLDWMSLSFWNNKYHKDISVRRDKPWKPHKQVLSIDSLEDELIEPKINKHSDLKTISLINPPLWDKAEWSGTFFQIVTDYSYPPTMGLMFKNEESARNIFEEWKEKFGNHDKDDEIKISIIKGIDKDNPHYYKVLISSNLDNKNTKGKAIKIISRFNLMTPSSSKNIDMFTQYYNAMKAFYIIPAVLISEQEPPKILNDLFIVKHKITIKEAWEINEHDLEIQAIQPTDITLIPEGVENPPITKVLELLKRIDELKSA